MKNYIFILIVLCLFSCGNEDPDPNDNAVHLVGYLQNSNMDGDETGGYWKDGVFSALTSGNILSRPSSLYVSGSSVLIGGIQRMENSMPAGVFWRDGVKTDIEGAFGEPMIASHNNNLLGVWNDMTTGWVFHKNGITKPIIDTAYSFAPMAMKNFGEDIYTSGYSSGRPPLPPDYSSPAQHAQYWKNGQLIFREDQASNALSITLHQNNIYMAGYVSGSDFSKACYWKNDQRVDLTDGSKMAIAKSIFVTNEHVYVAGMIDNQAVYWKDGVAVNLTSEGTFSMANSIVAQGDDLHVAGYAQGHPAYWKNDVKQDIDNQDKMGKILFVVVGSNN